ncbi:hypothetical protein SCHPADRAFT_419020 [Schizopora paradoxa]|uniref:DUF6533 domain-containing protein n=1 Tax=Schizopora paradoxa TaxID=27342 RepID=A0A0H2RLH3_9AGAM|nr:hypothetical protein SCHPADRAFT_419020 [Schizopora paradoxa]
MAAMSVEMPHLLQGAVNVKYSFIAGFALLVYDVVINLSSEIELIWRCRWSFGKIIYILARYSGFVDAAFILYYAFSTNLTIESCRSPYVTLIKGCMLIGVAICHCVLVIRTFVIWERNISTLGFMCSILIVGFALKVYVIVKMLHDLTFAPSPMPAISACIPIQGSDTAFIIFCIDTAFEFQIVALTLYKGLFRWKSVSTPLIRTIYRDGFIYFAVILCISLANTLLCRRMFSTPYVSIAIMLHRIFHSILASRVIMNLRKAVYEKPIPTISTAHFGDAEMQSGEQEPQSTSQA